MICVETTAIVVLAWAKATADPRMSHSEHHVWFKGRRNGQAKILARGTRRGMPHQDVVYGLGIIDFNKEPVVVQVTECVGALRDEDHICNFKPTQKQISESKDLFDHREVRFRPHGPPYEPVVCDPTNPQGVSRHR